MSTRPTKTPPPGAVSPPRRELHVLALYRLLEASILVALLFGSFTSVLGPPNDVPPGLPSGTTIFYMSFSVAILLFGDSRKYLLFTVILGVCVDIAIASVLTYAFPQAAPGIAMMLLFNVAAACSLLPKQWGVGVAIVATAAYFMEYLVALFSTDITARPLAEVVMFCISYLSVGLLAVQVGMRARRSQQLADERGLEVANLVEVSELIIRRMRTGVLVVDLQGHIRLSNEAANNLLGSSSPTASEPYTGQLLQDIAPELYHRLQRWRDDGQNEETQLTLTSDQPAIQPRFARLLAGSKLALVFLDDATVVSRRAESMTLAALGRFSASLAHEIRNPLAAINYAVQLMEESQDFTPSDRHLLSIIHQQCQRTNSIVESVLSLARRERANPEHTDLNSFVAQFVSDYQQTMSIETDCLSSLPGNDRVIAMIDPRHLHQILTALVNNALTYGRRPGKPAYVCLRIYRLGARAIVEVIDQGPGIPASVAAQLFHPFFTTSEYGTGLGLYIARELCLANQSTLEYSNVPEGGSCFRIAMPGPNTLLAA